MLIPLPSKTVECSSYTAKWAKKVNNDTGIEGVKGKCYWYFLY